MSRSRYFDSVSVAGGELNVSCHRDPKRSPAVFVLLHDASETATSWRLVLDRFPANVAALAPDLRGRGASSGLGSPVSIEQYVDDLTKLLDHFGVDQAGLLGIGSGSVLAEHLGELLVDRIAVTLGIDRAFELAALGEPALDEPALEEPASNNPGPGDFDRRLLRDRLLSGEPSRHTRRIIVGSSIDALAARELDSTDATFVKADSCQALVSTAAGADAVADLVRVVVRAPSHR